MNIACAVAVYLALAAGSMAVAEEVKLPPEVTPELRAACESDVRRVGCLGSSPTYAKVKSCVIAKYMQLGSKCKYQLALAGYSGPKSNPKPSEATASKAAPAPAKGGGLFGGVLEAFAK